ncbi:MAG TPA: DinB family protein [Bacteroidota bacterium]|nr:DinB family protein [Bacteroidota bacterium]
MKKSDLHPIPQYYDRYINLVPDVELSQAFDASIRELDSLDRTKLARLEGKRYAPGKWTINDIFQHLTDTERIMCYRTLLYARRDSTYPPGFDQDLLALNAHADKRPVHNLIQELTDVRRATASLFGSFDDETLQNKGISWTYEVTVLAMGFMIVGHQIHHLKGIEDKYYPLLDNH